MANTIAGGPLSDGSVNPQKADAGDGVDALASKDQKTQTQANEGQFTKSQVDEMVAAAVSAANQGKVDRAEMELNVGKVRSQYDRARNEERSVWDERDRNYQTKIHELTVKDMDDNAKARFERDLFAQRAAELEERQTQTLAELEASKLTGQYLKALKTNFGVEIDQVDLSDMNNLSQSAFDAAAKQYQTVKAELDALKSTKTGTTTADQSTALKPAQDVVTKSGGTNAGPVTLLDMRKAVSQRLGIEGLISEDKLFEMAERPEITGVDMNVVLDAIQAELDEQEKQAAPAS